MTFVMNKTSFRKCHKKDRDLFIHPFLFPFCSFRVMFVYIILEVEIFITIILIEWVSRSRKIKFKKGQKAEVQ